MESPVNNSEDIDGVIRQTLSTYNPGSTRNLQGHGFKRVCLQLFGLEGDGKSSLVNSCLCVVHNSPFSNEAGAGTTSESSTTARKEYKLTDIVYMFDNRGLKRMTIDARLELSAQLRNLRSTSKVDWEFEVEKTVNQLEDIWNNHSMDFIVPVFVYSTDRAFDKGLSNEFGPFLRTAFEITGIFPIVVLTKNKTPICAEAQEVIGELGCQHIFILDNYTTTNPARSAAADSHVLKFLNVCLQEADRGIQKRQNWNSQWEFIKQTADQIKAEMKRQKELQEEELGRKDAIINYKDTISNCKEKEWNYKEDRWKCKEKEMREEETQTVRNLNSEIEDLRRRLSATYN